ncbi:MAG: radical SAM protein [Methanothrix sp.]|jgi:MoaA/NifB/PqqE/SkfB family radical SAM enzyme|uniref:Radical SAM domain family protein n=1 Tax=Methanothrix harundinacea TaxID=301375 RepID=A0A101FUT0_9EURY|nr:MAG: pyrroloquinoline quinone biosynthesis protein PqqE [Methanosaeta sp. SDB]KUK44754.1 MAG: Radical SAM domain family protein [Methanothrix harundinacea]MDD2637698.1 radical SAM protein [Methanothrix sp.]MDD5050011.1 radical SAM protein [Methanoregulaceae archaeon]MDI9399481.1 radical SAM protein [Euryarchaeota archaeon]
MPTFHPKIALRALAQMRVRKRPFVLSHGINARCNLRCPFCEYWRAPGPEMTTEAVFAMLDDAKSFGIGVYNAWTAEPLLRPDLPEILGHARSLGIATSLITNGQLLSDRIEDLEDLDYLSVSVDGIKTYREIRGASVEPVIEGIRAARKKGHQVLMNCVISRKNLSELETLVGLAEELGALVSFEPLHETPEVEGDVWEDMGIGDADLPEYRRSVDRLIEMKREGRPIINSLTYLEMVRDRNLNFRCHAPQIVLSVASDGTVQACRVHKEPLGNVSEGIARVWESSIVRREEIVRKCKGCLFFGYVENSLLYDFRPEVLAHYQWM